MTRLWTVNALLCFALTIGIAQAQGTATIAPRAQTSSSEKKVARKGNESSTQDDSAPKPDKIKALKPDEPIVTEIYADKTVFDSGKSIGIFTGNVVVTDPRFNIQGDMLTV